MSKFRKAIVAIILSSLLGILLVILSLWYQNPPGCRERFCINETCPANACRGGASLRAGFPFPIVHDQTDSSPTTSWGRIDIDDLSSLDFSAFLLDALFYGVIIIILVVIVKTFFRWVKRSRRLG